MIKKLLIVFVISLFSATVHCTDFEEQMKQTADMLRQVCQPKFKIPDEQVEGARVGKFANDKNFKCYVHCVLEMLGMMKKNKVNFEQTLKQFDALLPEDYKGPWKHAMTVCQDKVVVVKNPCDYAMNIVQCFYENNSKFTFA